MPSPFSGATVGARTATPAGQEQQPLSGPASAALANAEAARQAREARNLTRSMAVAPVGRPAPPEPALPIGQVVRLGDGHGLVAEVLPPDGGPHWYRVCPLPSSVVVTVSAGKAVVL